MKHPRPQMIRDKYFILKDNWLLNGHPINVPYPPEATLSKFNNSHDGNLNYECRFFIPNNFTLKRILLHFGAVDQISEIYINKRLVGKHEGGYLPFYFDISDFIIENEENILEVNVTDNLSVTYPYGKHGMLVIQDMVNSGTYSYLKDTVLPTIIGNTFIDTTRIDKKNKDDCFRKNFFKAHMIETINKLYNHPSIIVYTIFNEGWGQFDSDNLYKIAKQTDSSRLYDSTSGWFAQNNNDFDSIHIYFRTKKIKPTIRPLLLSECGGFSYKINGHVFNHKKIYGYGNCNSSAKLTDRIIKMYNKMVIPAIKHGLCGCIYTQLSDVEDEINGLYTYDREICKVDKDKLIEISNIIMNSIDKI